MPGENVYDWSVTATNNGSADALINWAEGQPRASVNNSARSMMAALAKQRNLLNGSITVAGTANALTFISGVGFTAVPANMRVLLKLSATNTGSATLNMDGIGDVTIKNPVGADLVAGDLKASYFAEFVYNGTNWILLSVYLPPVVLTNGTITTVGTNTITVTTGLNLAALFNGLRLTLKIGTTNTGPVTMNVDGLGAKEVVDQLGNPLVGGELVAGAYADFLYNGTKWVLLEATLAPAFSASMAGTQALPNNVFVKLSLTTEVFDIGGYYATSRYTPLIRGRYMILGYAIISGMDILYGAAGIAVYKNGGAGGGNISLAGAPTGGGYYTVPAIFDMNGSTDYVELWGFATQNGIVGAANLQGIRIS
jgi:hypothetical protein